MSKTLNEVYQCIKENRLSLEEGSKKIIEHIYSNPLRFGLVQMSEDERSDFILYLFEHFNNIIMNYSENMSAFSTYIINVVKKKKCAWYRNCFRARAKQESVKQYYINEEPKVFCEDPILYCNNVKNERLYNHKEALAILVIALKSSYYLTPYHISVLSQKTGYSEKTLCELKERIEQCIQKKIDLCTSTYEKISSSYIKKNSCYYELMRVEKNSCISERLKERHITYTLNWKRHLINYKKKSLIRPSNSQIAEVLNLKEHVVSRIIRETDFNKIESLQYN